MAFGKCNDAVKLAFMGREDLAKVGKLDLRCLESVHTGDKGVEIKLVDRAKLIGLLLEATEERPDPKAAAGGLIAAIDGAADKLAGAEGVVEPLDVP